MSSEPNHTVSRRNSKACYRHKKSTRCRRDIVISSLCTTAVIAALGLVAELSEPWLSQTISGVTIKSADADNSQIGTLTLQTDENICDFMKFDNETGRTIEHDARCRKAVTLDAHGVPVPMSTVHRLGYDQTILLGR